MIKKLHLFLIGLVLNSSLNSQTFYIQADSVFFSIKLESLKKDSIDKFIFTIKNNSFSDLFLCKMSSRAHVVYINSVDGPLVFGSGCQYGFNQDFNYAGESYDIVKISKQDSYVFEIAANRLILNRKITMKEFWKKDKLFSINYVRSTSPLLFLDKKNYYHDFTSYNKQLIFSVPAISK